MTTEDSTVSYGFALKHPYGVVTLVSGFLLSVFVQDLMMMFGAVEYQHPYVLIPPVVGAGFFFVLGFVLAFLHGGQEQEGVVSSFTPIFTIGFSIWLLTAITIQWHIGNLLSVTLTAIALGSTIVSIVVFASDVTFSRPKDVTLTGGVWPALILVGNAVSFAVLLGVLLGHVSAERALLAFIIYAVTTISYPLALFSDAYSVAHQYNLTWRMPVFAGCLGVATFITLGALNWLTTSVYTVFRVAVWLREQV